MRGRKEGGSDEESERLRGKEGWGEGAGRQGRKGKQAGVGIRGGANTRINNLTRGGLTVGATLARDLSVGATWALSVGAACGLGGGVPMFCNAEMGVG